LSPRIAARLRRAALVAAMSGIAAPVFAQDLAIVANRVIYPGQTIAADALVETPVRGRPAGAGEFVTMLDEVEGKVARRTLLPGRLIPVSSVREPYAVNAGSAVQVLFVDGALIISVTAVPLEPGAIGDVVKLRNIDSGSVFQGVVMADGTIRVGAI
jgi:flagellar basal body P-ring formation protein FlgA